MARKKTPQGSKERELLRRIEDEPAGPVYLLSGRERFFVRRVLEILKKKVLPNPDMKELLHRVFYASEANADELLSLARTMPFFDRTQLILVCEADKIKETLGRMLLEYVEDPAPFTCMVLVAGEDLPNRAFFKTLQKNRSVACFGFPWLRPPQRRAWLRELAEEKGFSPRDSAVWMEELLAGGDVSLEVMDNQLDILQLYLEGGGATNREDSLPFVFASIPPEQGYRFTEPLLQGKGQESMEVLGRFVDQGTPPLLLFSRMVWEARRLWRIRDALESGQSLKPLFSPKTPPFVVDRFASAGRKVSRASLAQLFVCLHETEVRLKMGSRLDSRWHLEEACKAFVRAMKGQTVEP